MGELMWREEGGEFELFPVPSHKENSFNWSGKYALNNLKPATRYEAKVVAKNDLGWSRPCPPFHFATFGAEPYTNTVKGSAAISRSNLAFTIIVTYLARYLINHWWSSIMSGFSYHQEFFKSWTTKFQSEDKTSFKNLKKTSHHHLIILIFRISLSFFFKIVPHLSQIFVFSFSIFLEIFRQTKNFMKERSSSENWKKKRRRKLKEKKKKNFTKVCIGVIQCSEYNF